MTQFWFSLIVMVFLFVIILTTVAYCILAERKISAYMQDRLGPNRVGRHGWLQPLADGLKFFFKEDITPSKVDRGMFYLAPVLIFIVALVGFAVIPWGGVIKIGENELRIQVASIDVGLLYILAVGSLGVYGTVLGAWSSNNKYSFFGGMRAAAQMLSYEVPLGLGILVIVMTSGGLRLEHMVEQQLHHQWFIFYQPLAFLMVFIAQLAEANRMPFDLAESEQELVGGFHTEYSSMKFAMFFLAEYAHLITNSAFLAVMFLGGWDLLPLGIGRWLAAHVWGFGWLHSLNYSTGLGWGIVRFLILFGKVCTLIGITMWIRWTLPRFRYDQLMRLAWKGLVPLGLMLVVLTTILVFLNQSMGILPFVGNVVILAILLFVQQTRPSPVTGRQSSLRPMRSAVSSSGGTT